MCLDHTPETPQFKQCTKCKEIKHLGGFHRQKSQRDGYRPVCKECRKGNPKLQHGPAVPPGTKDCAKCRRLFPATPEFFWRHRLTKDKLAGACKECGGKLPPRIPREGYKFCSRCNTERPATTGYFSRAANTPDGLRSACKECLTKRFIAPARDGYKRCTKCRAEKPANKEHFHASVANKDGLISWCKVCQEAYRVANAERIATKKLEYARSHPEVMKASRSRRRARVRSAKGTHTALDIQRQYKAQKGKCYYCKVKVGKDYHADHVIPLARGGSNGPENLVIACPRCNQSKRDKMPHEWAGSNRLL